MGKNIAYGKIKKKRFARFSERVSKPMVCVGGWDSGVGGASSNSKSLDPYLICQSKVNSSQQHNLLIRIYLATMLTALKFLLANPT